MRQLRWMAEGRSRYLGLTSGIAQQPETRLPYDPALLQQIAAKYSL